jgi:hypothetical protein
MAEIDKGPQRCEYRYLLQLVAVWVAHGYAMIPSPIFMTGSFIALGRRMFALPFTR